MRIPAKKSTRAAVVHGGDSGFAPIRRIAVAIEPSWSTHRHALAVAATCRPLGIGACSPACAAVVEVGADESGFAPVPGITVTVAMIRSTNGYALTADATARPVGIGAGLPARPAVLAARCEVSLAGVTGIEVTVTALYITTANAKELILMIGGPTNTVGPRKKRIVYNAQA